MSYDVAIVGAGIIGLTHAFHFAKRGLRVVVFEKQPLAQGASIRNFGMIWPIGQPLGDLYTLALRSRSLWVSILQESGIWYSACGSLHLAYHEDESAILQEFVQSAKPFEIPLNLLQPNEILTRYPAVEPNRLQLGLYSQTELTVDPRQVIRELPHWLNRKWGIDFFYDTGVLGYEDSIVRTNRGQWQAQRMVLATGSDFRNLFSDSFSQLGLVLCKLQMMRSQPYDSSYRLNTMIAGGLTLRHYKAFSNCPTLPNLIKRLDREYPDYHHYGIHVMAAQNGLGEVVIGDSHEYGSAIEPFDKSRIDELILKYLHGLLRLPNLEIQARWHGLYVKHPIKPFIVIDPKPNVRAVIGLGGAGMTLSFGLAERVVQEWLGEKV